MDQSADPDRQYQLIETRGTISYYRVIPQSFVSDTVVAEGTVLEVPPQETHKYTVVVWLEGDDPDCTNEMIGGHVGMEMKMALITEEEENTFRAKLEDLWENLRFWEKEEENTPTTNPAT
jgi:hypothetical protein